MKIEFQATDWQAVMKSCGELANSSKRKNMRMIGFHVDSGDRFCATGANDYAFVKRYGTVTKDKPYEVDFSVPVMLCPRGTKTVQVTIDDKTNTVSVAFQDMYGNTTEEISYSASQDEAFPKKVIEHVEKEYEKQVREHGKQEVGVNPQMLIQALRNLKDKTFPPKQYVILEFVSPTAPLMIRIPEDQDHSIVYPVLMS